MNLSNNEKAIIENLRRSFSMEEYKAISNEMLINLINNIDEYVDEYGKTLRSFNNYDEFYLLQFNSVKRRLIEEYMQRSDLDVKVITCQLKCSLGYELNHDFSIPCRCHFDSGNAKNCFECCKLMMQKSEG